MITKERLEELLRMSLTHSCKDGCRVCEDRACYQSLKLSLEVPLRGASYLVQRALEDELSSRNPETPAKTRLRLEQLVATAKLLRELQE